MTDSSTRWPDSAARIFIALLFLYSGFGKLMDPGSVAAGLSGAGFPLPTVAAYITIAVDIGASAALIFGYRILVSCAVLAAFTVLATIFFHQFWAVEATQRSGQTVHLLKNLAIIGGLWFVVRVNEVTDASERRPAT